MRTFARIHTVFIFLTKAVNSGFEKFNVFFFQKRQKFVHKPAAFSYALRRFVVFAVYFEIYADVARIGGKDIEKFLFVFRRLSAKDEPEVFFFFLRFYGGSVVFRFFGGAARNKPFHRRYTRRRSAARA